MRHASVAFDGVGPKQVDHKASKYLDAPFKRKSSSTQPISLQGERFTLCFRDGQLTSQGEGHPRTLNNVMISRPDVGHGKIAKGSVAVSYRKSKPYVLTTFYLVL